MNLIKYYNNRVPKYYDDLKVGDEVMFIKDNEVISYTRRYINDYFISYDKLYKIVKILNRENKCGTSICISNYKCITVKAKNIYPDSQLLNSHFSTCGFVLANKLGQRLKIRIF